jgi:hypothetical protein
MPKGLRYFKKVRKFNFYQDLIDFERSSGNLILPINCQLIDNKPVFLIINAICIMKKTENSDFEDFLTSQNIFVHGSGQVIHIFLNLQLQTFHISY